MRPLTQQQAKVLAFIASQAIPPTIREICAHFGFCSPRAAAGHLAALEAKGAITRRRRKARAIEISPSARGLPLVGCIGQDGRINCISSDEDAKGDRSDAKAVTERSITE